MRLLVSSGEASGELYAAELLRHLRRSRPDVSAFGLGGDALASQGAELVAHVRELAVVGLLEVVSHLPRLRAVFRAVLAEAERRRPELAVLVDYPDFNLRLARALRRRGIPVVYYVSPQVWAWRRGRIRTIRATARRVLVIFPFEEAIYREAGVPVRFVGHPLVDLVARPADPGRVVREHGLDAQRPVVAVLPGSRAKEIAHNLPPLAGAVRRLAARPDRPQFLLALAPHVDEAPLKAALGDLPVALVRGRAHEVLASARVALVASGTATVEAALLGAPMVVVYRVSAATYLLGRPLVRVPHYAMVNLIAGRRVVAELIQGDFTEERVALEAARLLDDDTARARMLEDLAEVRRLLGGPGASGRAAEALLQEWQALRGGVS
jgi:lipid-A-disaccharide synthase